MMLHSVVNPQYIFPQIYAVNSVNTIKFGYCETINNSIYLHSTNPYDYINGRYIEDNRILSDYIFSWRETDANRKKY